MADFYRQQFQLKHNIFLLSRMPKGLRALTLTSSDFMTVHLPLVLVGRNTVNGLCQCVCTGETAKIAVIKIE